MKVALATRSSLAKLWAWIMEHRGRPVDTSGIKNYVEEESADNGLEHADSAPKTMSLRERPRGHMEQEQRRGSRGKATTQV